MPVGQVAVSYLPGEANVMADRISRWRKKGLGALQLENEVSTSLACVLHSLPMCMS